MQFWNQLKTLSYGGWGDGWDVFMANDFKFLHFLELGAWWGWWLRDLVGFATVACSCAKTAESSGSQSPWKGPNSSSSSVIRPGTSPGSPRHRFWKLHKKSIIRRTNVCNNKTQQCPSAWESDDTLKGQFDPEQKMHIPEQSIFKSYSFSTLSCITAPKACSVTEPWLILFLYIITGNYVLLHLLLQPLTLSLPVIA